EEYEPMGVLLDLGLPDTSGESVLDHFKRNENLRHIPVCIVSARDVDLSLLERGAIDYLQKPIAAEEVKDAIQRLVGISDKSTKHLLIVQDNPAQNKEILELIGREGVESYAVNTIDEAKRELSREVYDALVIDIAVENNRGLEVCHHVKDLGLKLPIIVYTADDLTEEEEKELQLQSVSVIIKSDESEFQLIEKVRLFLHQMKKEQEQSKKEPVAFVPPEEPEAPLINVDDILADDDEGSDELHGMRILVVDDDVRNVFVITSALENHDATMFEAFNGQEALEVLEQEEVDLVLMDIMMPILDGYETMRLIRLKPEFEKLPIIAVTAKVQKEDREKCFEAGASDYLSKPIDYEKLMDMIKQYAKEKK
ncbi:MAG: response regulator, partial [Bacteroidota bacterium]